MRDTIQYNGIQYFIVPLGKLLLDSSCRDRSKRATGKRVSERHKEETVSHNNNLPNKPWERESMQTWRLSLLSHGALSGSFKHHDFKEAWRRMWAVEMTNGILMIHKTDWKFTACGQGSTWQGLKVLSLFMASSVCFDGRLIRGFLFKFMPKVKKVIYLVELLYI